MMSKFIPLMSPSLSDADIESVVRVLRSGMLVQGQNVAALEQSAIAYTGAPHARAVSNGTATLHLALIALGIGPGDEVIVPALSYVATANVVELVGATPVFVDVEAATFNMDPALLDSAVTSRTKGIMPVHEFGLAARIAEINRWAQQRGIAVIEDAACALGARENGRHVGTTGIFGSFSFHPRKAITAGEGGLLLTPFPAMSHAVNVLRNHGLEVRDGQMNFVKAGFNYRMTDFQAALVHSQWSRIDAQIAYKQELAAIYDQELNREWMALPSQSEARPHTWQTYHVVLHERVDRARLLEELRNAGIGANYGAQCIPAVTFYQNKYGLNAASLFPEAFAAYTRGLALPIYQKLELEDIRYIAQSINHLITRCLV